MFKAIQNPDIAVQLMTWPIFYIFGQVIKQNLKSRPGIQIVQ